MKRFLLCLALLDLGACAHSPAYSKAMIFRTGLNEFQLTESRPSVKGRYLFTELDLPSSPDKLEEMRLISLDTTGELSILRTVRSRYRALALMDLRPVEPHLYAYTACVPSKIRCTSTTLHFIDSDGRDVFPLPVPSESDDMNFHDYVRAKDGHYFFLFANFDFKASGIDNAIQEWNETGKKLFNWRLNDHSKELTRWPNRDLAHINSIDLDADGNILIGIWQFNAIFKIAYPSGKILATITSPEWKFENDSYNGFKAQHGVRSLPNGNILLFDNGDGVAGRATRAVEYALDDETKTAKLVWEYRIPASEPNFRPIGGSVQRLSNGNTLIGWGVPSSMTATANMLIASEVDPHGQLVRELRGRHFSFRMGFEELKP